MGHVMANNISRTRVGTLKGFVCCTTFVASMLIPYAAAAQSTNTNWVDWNIPDTYALPAVGGGSGFYTLGVDLGDGVIGIEGSALIPNTSTLVTVTHTGEVHELSKTNSPFRWELSGQDSSYYPANTYTNPPFSPNSPSGFPGSIGSDIIIQTGFTTPEGKQHKVSFSSPVNRVLMAFFSLGGCCRTASLTFDQDFTIISSNSDGPGEMTASGRTLSGTEGGGVIQFLGTAPFSDISWIMDPGEFWGGVHSGV